MARKRRKSNSQRRRPARARNAAGGRRSRNANRPEHGGDGVEAAHSGAAAAATGAPATGLSETLVEANDGSSSFAQVPEATTAAKSSWPTRRKRSQIVDLPVQELDHIRGDLARIGLLSLGMVVILVALTIVLR